MTRVRCSTSQTRTSLYNPRTQRRYRIENDIPHLLVDEATSVDDAEHKRLLAKAEAEGIRPTFEG